MIAWPSTSGGRRTAPAVAPTGRLSWPDPAGEADDELKLGPLVGGGDRVRDRHRREPALRRQRQFPQRLEARRLLDPGEHVAVVLKPRRLRGEQPEDHGRSLADVREGLETARAVRVVLQ